MTKPSKERVRDKSEKKELKAFIEGANWVFRELEDIKEISRDKEYAVRLTLLKDKFNQIKAKL